MRSLLKQTLTLMPALVGKNKDLRRRVPKERDYEFQLEHLIKLLSKVIKAAKIQNSKTAVVVVGSVLRLYYQKQIYGIGNYYTITSVTARGSEINAKSGRYQDSSKVNLYIEAQHQSSAPARGNAASRSAA